MRYQIWGLGRAIAQGTAVAIGLAIGLADAGAAQIVPDGTLGTESSQVADFGTVDAIAGGAKRGSNLFHSFREFNVGEGQYAYFLNSSTDIRNILARVTGNNRSEIMGTLGVFNLDGVTSNPTLFLINPNGIIFGPNSSLDVGGSFVGTTANAIGFGDQGFFSATNPEAPPLLTVSPSAFFFNQNVAGNILVNSSTPLGLSVANGQNLLLLGGNVSVDGGQLSAFGGRIEIGAVVGTGTVEMNADSSLSFPVTLARGDVSFTNRSRADVTFNQDGDIGMTARNIDVSGNSSLTAGIYTNSGAVGNQAGDVKLNATGDVRVRQGSGIANTVLPGASGNAGSLFIMARSLFVEEDSQLSASTFGQGNSGNVIIHALDRVSLDKSSSSTVTLGAGQSGNVEITTGILSLTNGSQLFSITFGESNSGNVIIHALDRVSLDDSGVFSRVEPGGRGQGGNVDITTGVLSLSNGSQLDTSIYGQGNSGSVIIHAHDRVSLDGKSGALSRVEQSGVGQGGNVNITTGSLSLINGSQLDSSTLGQGDGGSIVIHALDQVHFDNGAVFSSVGTGGIGRGGNIEITAGTLTVQNGAQLITSTSGQGNAGNVIIHARDRVSLTGESADGRLASAAFSNVEQTGTGRGGNVEITTETLDVQNGAQLITSTSGQGNAGSVIIHADDRVSLVGRSKNGRLASAAFSSVDTTGIGRGGNVEITTGTLDVQNGAVLDASTNGRGDAGSVIISAHDRVSFIGRSADGLFPSAAYSRVQTTGIGRGGNVEITTRNLDVQNGARLFASTLGQGNAGSVIINARDRVSFTGESADERIASAAFSSVGTTGAGRGGNVEITTGTLNIQNGAQLIANTLGQGDAGSIIIRASHSISLSGIGSDGRSSGILSNAEVNASGQGGRITVSSPHLLVSEGAVINATTENNERGGDIQVTADRIEVTNGGQLIATTRSNGQAGNVTLNADRILLSGRDVAFSQRLNQFGRGRTANEGNGESGLFANTRPNTTGNGGTISIHARMLELEGGAAIAATTSGTGSAGDIIVRNSNSVSLNNSSITTAVNSGAVLSNSSNNQGNINLQTRSLSLTNGAQITASTSGTGNAGSIDITAPDRIIVSGAGFSGTPSNISSTVELTGIGRGGDITLNTGSLHIRDRAILNTSTSGQGNAGNIQIIARNRVLFDRQSTIGAINNAPLGGNNYRGGDISIQTGTLSVRNGAQILTSTSGQGRAGDIRINARDRISLDGQEDGKAQSRLSSLARSSVEATGVGRAGNIYIRAGELSLTNSGQLVSSTFGRGDAGRIFVNVARDIRLNNSGLIQSGVGAGGTGNGGDIRIQARSLSATNGSQIAALVFRQQSQSGNTTAGGRGNGGDIRLDIAGSTVLSGVGATGFSGGLLTLSERGAAGRAGNVTINTDDLQVTDGAIVTAATFNPGGIGGNVTVNARTLEVLGGGQILTNTRNTRKAGQVDLNIAHTITLSGNDPNFSNRLTQVRRSLQDPHQNPTGDLLSDVIVNEGAASGIYASASSRATGQAGSIRITTDRLNLQGGAEVAVNSRGTGQAGNLAVRANDIRLDRGTLTAETRSTREEEGANITLGTHRFSDLQRLYLQNGSQISARAFDNANGGNITINANDGFVAARVGANQNNDIIARASGGNGGQVTITAQSILGLEQRSSTPVNSTNDIDISSDRGLQGTVTLNIPNTDPSRGLTELTTVPTDATNQIAAACPTSAEEADRLGSFIVSGRGGLPPSPIDLLSEDNTLTEWVTSEAEANAISAPVSLVKPETRGTIVEAQGLALSPEGKAMLVAEPAAPLSPSTQSQSFPCH